MGLEGQRAFLQVAQAIGAAELPLKRSNALLSNLWVTMKNTMRWQLTSSALHGFIGSIQTAYGYTKDLNESLNNIRIVTQQSTEQMAKFAEQANKAAKNLSTTTTNYTKASLIYYQQGLPDDQVAARTNTTIKMANVAGESAETISQQMTAIWNNFDDGTRSLESFGDAMVKLGAETASSSGEIAEGIEKFAPIAKTVGLSFDYAAAALATVTATTRESASVAGTALKTLFSRIEGLTLGETLDDGTDLNKYSQALEKVGINIKDVSGEMKDMDTILDELGEKWQHLTRDQQMALAETVAGVRQYTQLVAIMDNWDFMQENIARARNSSGSLEEQAQIYAESWEAARKRVKAAAEDIYDSLINEDFFIGFDNVLAPFLSGVATAVDSFGGLQGILASVALLMNKVYGDKIAQSARDLAVNIGLQTGAEQTKARILQQQSAEAAKNLTLVSEDNIAISTSVDLLQRKVELQSIINQKADSLSDFQLEQIANEQQLLDVIRQQIQARADSISKMNEQSEDHATEMLMNADEVDYNRQLRQTLESIKRNVQQSKIPLSFTVDPKEIESTFYSIKNNIDRIMGDSGNLLGLNRQRLKKAADEASQAIKSGIEPATDEIKKLLVSIGEYNTAMDSMDSSQLVAHLQTLVTESDNADAAIKALKDAMDKLGVQNPALNEYIVLMEKQATQTHLTAQETERLRELEQQLGQNVIQGKFKDYQDWANAIVKVGSGLSQLAMGINAVKSLGRVFSDDDMSASDRLITTLTSLSMLFPTISNAIGLFNTQKAITVTLNGVEEASTQKVIAARLAEVIATRLAKSAKEGETAAIIANTAAKYANNLIMLAAIAVIATLAVTIYSLAKAYKADAIAAQKAAKAAEDTAKAANEAKTAADNLRSSINAYDSAVEKLNECTKGTEEWRDALKEVNAAAIEVLNNAGKLSADQINSLRNPDGSLNRQALSNLQTVADQRAANLSYASAMAEKYASNMQLRADAMSLGRKGYSVNDETYGDDTLDRDVILANLTELANLSDNELLPALRKLGFQVSDSEKNVSTWRNAIADMADSAEAADAKFKLISQMQVEDILGPAETILEQAVQTTATSNLTRLTEQYTQDWQDLLTGSGISKVSGADNEIYQQTLAALQAAGYDLSKQTSNAVRGTDSNRSLAFLNASGQEVVYNSEQIAAMLGAAQALDELGASAQEIQASLSAANEQALDYIASGGFGNITKAALQQLTDEDAIVDAFGGRNAIAAIIAAQKGVTLDAAQDLVDGFVAEVLNTVEATQDDWDSIGQGMARSVQRALSENVNDETFANTKIIADIFNRATAYGELERAIEIYSDGGREALEQFNSELGRVAGFSTEAYAAIRKIIDGLDTGDTISQDDYETLLANIGDLTQDYFDMMLDGTYQLTKDAIDFKEAVEGIMMDRAKETISNLKSNNDYLNGLTDADFSRMGTFEGAGSYVGGGSFVASGQAMNLLNNLGDESDRIFANKLAESGNLVTAQDIVELSERISALREQFGDLDGAIDSNQAALEEWQTALALSYDNFGDLDEALKNGEISATAYTKAFKKLQEAENLGDLNPKEVRDYAKYLQQLAAKSEGAALGAEKLSKDLANDEKAASDVAAQVKRMTQGVETLAKDWDNWSDILQNSTEGSEEYYNALTNTKNALSDLLGISTEFMSPDLVLNNMDLISQAATGDAEAIDQLRQAALEDIILHLELDDTELTNGELLDRVLALQAELDAMFPNGIEVGTNIDMSGMDAGEAEFIDKLNSLISEAGMSASQVNAMLAGMGFTANFASEPQKVMIQEPDKVTTHHRITNRNVTEMEGGAKVEEWDEETTTETTPGAVHEGEVDAYSLETSEPGTTVVPQINSITRRASGSANNYSSHNAGGGSPGGGSKGGGGGGKKGKSPKSASPTAADVEDHTKVYEEEVDRYHVINRELERQGRILTKIGHQIDRTYGLDRLAAFTKEQEQLNKEVDDYKTKLKEADGWLKTDTDRLTKSMGTESKAVQDYKTAIVSLQSKHGTLPAAITSVSEKASKIWTGYTVAIDESTHEISNYDEIVRNMVDDWNDYAEAYQAKMLELEAANERLSDQQDALKESEDESANAQLESIASQIEGNNVVIEQLKTEYEYLSALYDERMGNIGTYEGTIDEFNTTVHQMEDALREIEDSKLNAIEYRLEVVMDVHDARQEIRDFVKEIAESFGDALTHGTKSAMLGWEQAQDEMAMYQEYVQQYGDIKQFLDEATEFSDTTRAVENLRDLEGKIIDSGEALLDWLETVEDMFVEALDAAVDRFSYFTDSLEHNSSILSTIKELYALQGATYKTAEGFSRLQKTMQTQLNTSVAQAQLQRQWYEKADSRLQQAQADLDALIAEKGADAEYDVRYDTLKKNRDALLEESRQAQEAWLEYAQESMEIAQQMYLDQIERTTYEFGKALSNGLGLDLLQDKYDHYIETEERYLDRVNEAYEVASWYDKLQHDIDETKFKTRKDRLKELQEEIDLRREGNTLSQYDLDILEAKYKVLQAQMALEDAQNNKSELELVRDSSGNWNYRYTANADDVAAKQQELLDAENEWYNLAKQQTKDVTNEIIATWTEAQEALNELYSDTTNFIYDEEGNRLSLTEEALAKEAEIREYYTEKVKYLETEKEVAITDMTEAGNQAMIHLAVAAGDTVSDITGFTAQEIETLVKTTGTSSQQLLISDLSQIQEILRNGMNDTTSELNRNSEVLRGIVGNNTGLIDMFDNVYARDLDSMTANTGKFESSLEGTIEKCQGHFDDYASTVSQVATDCDISLDKLDDAVTEVSDSTNYLADAGYSAVNSLWAQVDATWSAQSGYLALADSVMQCVYAMQQLAAESVVPDISAYSGTDTFEGISVADIASGAVKLNDYSEAMSRYVAGGGQVGDAIYTVLESARQAKWDTELTDEQRAMWSDNATLREHLLAEDDWYQATINMTNSANDMATVMDYAKEVFVEQTDMYKQFMDAMGFATGGYTGSFDGGKLAFLHEKELVLNAQDTENILSAVTLLRELPDTIFADIAKELDGNGLASMALLGRTVGTLPNVAPATMDLEQDVHVVAEFPNVTSAREIEEAFETIANDVAQWARRRKS